MAEAQEDVSFADLIQLREQQQAQIRKALARQNARLKDKLIRSASQGRDSEDDSGSSDDEAAAAIAAPAAAESQDRSLGLAAENGTSEPAGSGRKHHKKRRPHSDDGGVSLEAFTELSNVVGTLQQLVVKVQDSNKGAIDALRQHIDTRCDSLEEKISSLEAAVAVGDRTVSLLREEQTMQQLTLAGEIESVRATAESSDKRLDARDEAIQNVQTVVAQLNATCDSVEERVTGIESFPGALRAEFADLEDKFVSLGAGVRAERAEIGRQTIDLHAKEKEEFDKVIVEARAEYTNLHNNARESVEVVTNARDTIAALIAQGIQEVSTRLEVALASRTTDQDQKIAGFQQNQLVENHNQNETIHKSVSEMRNSVDSSLIAMRQQYDAAIKEQFDALVEIADQNEKERRAEFPIIDADRVAIMLQELQGAQVMIEGIARNTMSVGHRCPLQGRIKELEAKVDDLQAESAVFFGGAADAEGEGQGSGLRAARNLITFNVPIQTDDMTEDQLSPRERVAAMVERRLAAEMDRAGQELSDAKMWKDVEEAEKKGRRSQSQQHTQLPPVEPPTNRSRSSVNPGSMDEVRATLKLKQGQLAKVQQVLRTIQEKFHELTLKESKGASSGKQLAPEARKVAELIAKQKEAVYQHERQLVDQRNKLLHEIKDLSTREQDMLA